MKKYVPYQKLSKKAKQKVNAKSRRGWSEVSPITRSEKNPKAYNRRKSRKIDDDFTGFNFCLCVWKTFHFRDKPVQNAILS